MQSAFIFAERLRRDPFIKLIRVRDAIVEYRVEICERIPDGDGTKSQAYFLVIARSYFELVVRSRLGAAPFVVDGVDVPLNNELMECVFHEWRQIINDPKALTVVLVVTE